MLDFVTQRSIQMSCFGLDGQISCVLAPVSCAVLLNWLDLINWEEIEKVMNKP